MNALNLTTNDHPFLNDFRPEHLDILSECAQETVFEPGEVIFREGEIADKFYLLQRGGVILELHQAQHEDAPIQTIGEGDVLGWSWLFPPFRWHFQARTLNRTEAIVLNGPHLVIACNANHEFGYELMKRLAHVVLKRLQATRKKLLEKAEARLPV